MSRSLRYQQMTDEQILELAAAKQNDRDRYYVIQELEYRGLTDKVRPTKIEKLKEERRNRSTYMKIGAVVLFLFAISRLIHRLMGS